MPGPCWHGKGPRLLLFPTYPLLREVQGQKMQTPGVRGLPVHRHHIPKVVRQRVPDPGQEKGQGLERLVPFGFGFEFGFGFFCLFVPKTHPAVLRGYF